MVDIMDAVVITGKHADIDVARVLKMLEEAGEYDPDKSYDEFMKQVTEVVKKKASTKVDSFRFYGAKSSKSDSGESASFGTSGPTVK